MTTSLQEDMAEVEKKLDDIGAFMQDGDNRILELETALRAVWEFVKAHVKP